LGQAGVRFAHCWSVPVADPLGSNLLEIRMAEIRVEPQRRSLAWLWILLALTVVGGLVYYYMYYL
jgi:hypothetical protein